MIAVVVVVVAAVKFIMIDRLPKSRCYIPSQLV